MNKYRIVRQISFGLPYVLGEFENFHKCYMFFLKTLKHEESSIRELRSIGYYVVNDFYKNQYNLTKDCIKYSLQIRKNGKWVVLRLQDIY